VAVTTEEEQILERVYEQVSPSVVNIRVTGKTLQPRVFRFPQMPNVPEAIPLEAQGSGFVYDTAGHIVTNNHVVDNAEQIEVTFADDAIVPAKVVSTDPYSDLAVLKVDVDAAQLHPITLGDSDALKVGQLVIAIGSPFGFRGTLTHGVISGLGRSLPTTASSLETGTYQIPEVIQTDAPINPGNSGGPLLDAQGRVIGLNTAIESDNGSSAGVGFAIPINIIKLVVPDLVAKGRHVYPWLGISGQTLNPQLAEANGLPNAQRGILVVTVVENGPAAKAGLRGSSQVEPSSGNPPKGGDVITAIDGQPIKKFDELVVYLIHKTKVGQDVKLTILRDGKEQTITVTLGERPPTGT
jgi:2-alkenal reductase